MSPAAAVAPASVDRFPYLRDELARSYHFVLVMADDTTVLDSCEGVTTRLGYAPEDLIGTSLLTYLHPGDQERATAAMLRELLDPLALAPSIVVRVRHADGSWLHTEAIGLHRPDDERIQGMIIGCRVVNESDTVTRVLAADEFLFRSLATSASDGTCIFDRTGRRVYSSPSLSALLGYSANELAGLGPAELVHPDDVELWRTATKEALRSPERFARVECRLRHRDGHTMWIETTVINLLEDPTVGGVVAHVRNIDDRRRLEGELRRQAHTDALTGLGNRAFFMEALRLHGDRLRAVLFCDLDGFKAVNDAYGHDQGDSLLIAVAGAIQGVTGVHDRAARIGGDEFCVLIPAADDAQATQQAERLRAAVLCVTEPWGVGISIGIAVANPGDPVNDALSRSDRAMYRAKRAARNLIETA
jgi:diguanylate cyclase (GGDEF)-like protein/PAS domain S-box-containing protein